MYTAPETFLPCCYIANIPVSNIIIKGGTFSKALVVVTPKYSNRLCAHRFVRVGLIGKPKVDGSLEVGIINYDVAANRADLI